MCLLKEAGDGPKKNKKEKKKNSFHPLFLSVYDFRDYGDSLPLVAQSATARSPRFPNFIALANQKKKKYQCNNSTEYKVRKNK